MNNQMMKTKKQVIRAILLIGLILLTFIVFMKGYSLNDIILTIKSANAYYLLAGLLLMLLFISCEAYNIHIILRVLGLQVLFRRCFLYSCIGFYFSSITPSASGGQPAQIYYMKKDKIPISISSVVIFYTVYIYQIAMILLGALALLFQFDTAVRFILRLKYLFLCGAMINVGAIFLFFLLMFSSKTILILSAFFLRIARKIKIKKAEEMHNKLIASVNTYHEKSLLLKQHPCLFLQVLFFTMIQMLALSLIPFMVYQGMGFTAENPMRLIACQALLTISVSAIPLPGSEGIAQVGFLQVFDLFFPQSSINYAMLLNRIISFYVPLVFTFFIYLRAHLKAMKQ